MHPIILLFVAILVPALWGGFVAWGMMRLWPLSSHAAQRNSDEHSAPSRTLDFQI